MNTPEHTPRSEKLLTPATILTASRPLLGFLAAKQLVKNRRGATALALTAAVTDMEGSLARAIDRRWPQSGRGSTKLGAVADKYADILTLITVAGATLKAPGVSRLGKVATAGIVAAETVKTTWALSRGAAYKKATGENLDFPPNRDGKLGMAAKFAAEVAAIGTSEVNPGGVRTALGVVAVGLSAAGAYYGERARNSYEQEFQQLMVAADADSDVAETQSITTPAGAGDSHTPSARQ